MAALRLTAALEPDYVVLGGGNVKKLPALPPGCVAGDNANAFVGGFRLWEKARRGTASGLAGGLTSVAPTKERHARNAPSDVLAVANSKNRGQGVTLRK